MIIKIERLKQLLLIAASLTHHDDALPPIDGFQDSEQSDSQVSFSTK
ncbi:hypothetical protein [Paraburkholderia sp. J8-2]|nr:hypothetical protein [Paraburkholderia sp. J8-2]